MGERFGEYELLRKIATGGMAEIYLARHGGVEGFSRRVVVKRMLPQLAVRQDFVTMFLDEARLAANLVHPNIVQVFNLGEVDDSYFMAMELIDGPHLGALFAHSLRQRRPLPIELCVYVVARAADGLAYAHDHVDPATGQKLNIVHRDISPQNILVSRHGDVKVTDFGVAKAETQQTKTRTGIIKGKVSYMSPEQCLGEVVDRRTDVFALGVVLYELLTRRRLYRDKSDLLVMQRITTEELKPPSSVNPAVDPELDRIALKALAKQKHERYQTATDLSEALDVWLATKGHADSRGQLQRWMAANADGLGVGAAEETSSPSWQSAPASAAPPVPTAAGPDEGTVATPILRSAGAASAGVAEPRLPDRSAGPPSGPTLIVPADEVERSDTDIAIEPERARPANAIPVAEDPDMAPGDTQVLVTLPPELLEKVEPGGGAPARSRRVPVPVLAGGLAAAVLAIAAVVLLNGSDPSQAATTDPDPGLVVTPEPTADPGTPVTRQDAGTKVAAAIASDPKPGPRAERPGEVLEAPAPRARLRVRTEPPGVPVMLNGTVLGKSPIDVEVEPGEAEVAAIFPDQKPVTGRVRLVADQDAELALLAKVPLTVRSSPPGAEIRINGTPEGTTPREGLWLEPGQPVQITLSKSGHQPWSGEVTPEVGKPLVIDQELRRKSSSSAAPSRPSPPAGEGKLRVDCRPWANVYINGRHIGITPTNAVSLRAGRHRVKVVNSELGFSKTTVVDVRKDAVSTVGFKFKKEGEKWVFDAVVK